MILVVQRQWTLFLQWLVMIAMKSWWKWERIMIAHLMIWPLKLYLTCCRPLCHIFWESYQMIGLLLGWRCTLDQSMLRKMLWWINTVDLLLLPGTTMILQNSSIGSSYLTSWSRIDHWKLLAHIWKWKYLEAQQHRSHNLEIELQNCW